MTKNAYVQFTGKLPKELKGTKLPIYGKVEKKIGKHKVVVKPRYKRIEVSVAIIDLTEVDHATYSGKTKAKTKAKSAFTPKAKPKAKAKSTSKKKVPACVTKKDIKKNSGVTKVVKKAKEELPAVKVAKSVTEKNTIATKTPSEMTYTSTSTEKKAPFKTETLKEADVPNTNWVKDDPINNPLSEDPHKALNEDSSLPMGVIIMLIICAAVVTYFLLN